MLIYIFTITNYNRNTDLCGWVTESRLNFSLYWVRFTKVRPNNSAFTTPVAQQLRFRPGFFLQCFSLYLIPVGQQHVQLMHKLIKAMPPSKFKAMQLQIQWISFIGNLRLVILVKSAVFCWTVSMVIQMSNMQMYKQNSGEVTEAGRELVKLGCVAVKSLMRFKYTNIWVVTFSLSEME